MKSTLLKFFLTLSAVLLFGLNASAQGTTNMGTKGFPTNESDIKFFFSVTGFSQLGGAGNSSTVYATVFDGNQDYNFEVVLPKGTNTICSDQATVRAMMRNVVSLDVDAKRTHEVTIKTGTTVTNQTLGGTNGWLKNTYQFQGATLPITVVDYNHGAPIYKEFEYQLNGATYGDGYRITGKRNDFQKAHDAWYLITKGPENINPIHVTAERKGNEDTFLDLPVGAYIQLGKEMITVDSEIKMSEGNFNLNTLCSMFKTPTTVQNAQQKAIFYLPAGTKLSIGASIATLNEAAKITFDLTNMPQGYTLDGVLSTLAEKAAAVQSDPNGDSGTSAKGVFIQTFLNMFDQLVAAVNAAETVPVLVEFGQPGPFIEVYAGKSTAEPGLKTLSEFKTILNSYPNAVGIVRNQFAITPYISACQAPDVKNIVIEYKVGSYNNYYYESPNFVFADATAYSKFDYYSPVDFIAVKGGYSRSTTYKNIAICVPFELSNDNIASGAYLMTFAYIQATQGTNADVPHNQDELKAWAYFNKRDVISPGVPCFMYDASKSGFSVEFNNNKIVSQPENSYSSQGSFITSTAYSSGYFWGPNSTDDQLGRYKGQKAVPFRCALDLQYTAEYNNHENNSGVDVNNIKSLGIAIIDDFGNVTSIDGVAFESKGNKKEIYTISGVKVNGITKSGLYIINGEKCFVK